MARSDTQAPRRPGTVRSRGFLHLGIRLLLALAWVGFLVAGTAAESGAFEVSAWVDKTEATLEDQIFLTVSISGQRRLPSDPILPPLPDFSVTKGGSSSQTNIVNGSISTSVEATYLLTPRRAGSFTIGPVRIEKKGRTYQSQPISVKILPAASSTEERPMAFVTQHVDVQNPYVHQQIVYTFRFLRRVQSVEAEWDPPSFQGFWVEDLGKERQYEKILNGQRYAVTELKKALYPLSENSVADRGNPTHVHAGRPAGGSPAWRGQLLRRFLFRCPRADHNEEPRCKADPSRYTAAPRGGKAGGLRGPGRILRCPGRDRPKPAPGGRFHDPDGDGHRKREPERSGRAVSGRNTRLQDLP